MRIIDGRSYVCTSDLNAVVIQADIGTLPFRPGAFYLIVSLGVLHHTPDTREYTRRLVPLLAPGGELAIWVYGLNLAKRRDRIPLTSRLPHVAFNDWCKWFVGPARAQPDNHQIGRASGRERVCQSV